MLNTFATGIALFAGAGSAALLPIVDDNCPAAVASIVAQPVTTRTSSPPVVDTVRNAADQNAVDAAMAVFNEAKQTDDAAQGRVATARLLVDDADDDYWMFDDPSYAVSSAQSAVNSAQWSLDSANDRLASYEGLRDSYGSDAYGMGDYYGDLVSDAQAEVEEAESDLATAKKELKSAQADEASAEKADADANSALQTAQADAAMTAEARETARVALEVATDARREHLAAEAAAHDDWQEQQVTWREESAAAERERVECREASQPKLGVGGGLALVGGALVSYSFVQRR